MRNKHPNNYSLNGNAPMVLFYYFALTVLCHRLDVLTRCLTVNGYQICNPRFLAGLRYWYHVVAFCGLENTRYSGVNRSKIADTNFLSEASG